MVKHKNESWKIKTVDGRGKGKGNDYQDVNGIFVHILMLTKSLFIANLTYEPNIFFLTELLKKY